MWDKLLLDVTIPLESLSSIEEAVEFAERAEAYGFATVSMPEVTGSNAVALQATLAAKTSQINITNDVFSPFSRSPALLGQTASTLHRLSDGRYRLGVGASSPGLAEDWHGSSFDRPLRRIRETIEIIDQVVRGERVDYSGEVYDLGGLRPDFEGIDDGSPVDVAALGPKSVEMTGRFADGWVPQMFTPDGLRNRLDDLRRGAQLGDRTIDDVRVAPIVRCCALEDAQRARAATRQYLVFLFAAYGPFYRETVAKQGWSDVIKEINAAWNAGDRDAAAEALPDELLDELVAAGSPRTVKERLETFIDIDGVDAVRVGFPSRLSKAEIYETLQAIAPDQPI